MRSKFTANNNIQVLRSVEQSRALRSKFVDSSASKNKLSGNIKYVGWFQANE